jgi:hypothetical protein
MTWLLNKIMSWMTGLITGSFTGVFNAVKTMLVSTPDVTTLPQVQALTGRAASILDIVFVLAFIAAGALTMAAGGSERVRYTAKDLLPRLVVAFVAAHFSSLFTSRMISVADGVATGLAAGSPGRLGAFTAIASELSDGSQGAGVPPLLFAVLAGMITFLFAAVAFTFITRLGVLIVLAIAAPLALACHALPQTDPVARLWWRSVAGCLTIPLLQVLTLQAGETVLLDPRSAGSLFGRPGGGILSLLVTIVLLWMTMKVPGLVRRYLMHTGGSSAAAQFLRVVIIGQGSRLVTGGLPVGGRLAARAGTTAVARVGR